MRNSLNLKTHITLLIFSFVLVAGFAQVEGNVQIESSQEIKFLMAKKSAYNRSLKKVKGYKIQLFNGSEQGAYRIRDEFSSLFPKMDIQIEFFSPEWKVRVGNFKSRIEADRALLEIKEAFQTAIILPALVEI